MRLPRLASHWLALAGPYYVTSLGSQAGHGDLSTGQGVLIHYCILIAHNGGNTSVTRSSDIMKKISFVVSCSRVTTRRLHS